MKQYSLKNAKRHLKWEKKWDKNGIRMNQNRAVLKKGHQKIYLRDREKNRKAQARTKSRKTKKNKDSWASIMEVKENDIPGTKHT